MPSATAPATPTMQPIDERTFDVPIRLALMPAGA